MMVACLYDNCITYGSFILNTFSYRETLGAHSFNVKLKVHFNI